MFAPLCILPGISSSSLCRPIEVVDSEPRIKWADFPNMMNVQSKTLGQLLDESIGGSSLSLEVRKAEMATVDLTTLVRVSDLKSNEILAEALTAFIHDAKKTARGLTKLGSKVGGAVDEYALLLFMLLDVTVIDRPYPVSWLSMDTPCAPSKRLNTIRRLITRLRQR